MSTDAPNAADAGQVNNAKAREKRRQQRIDNGVRAQMATPDGRLAMWDFLERCGLYRTSFAGSEGATAFNEGARNIGLQQLATIMRLCPADYAQMVIEGSKEND